MDRLANFLVRDLLANQTDEFERARTRVVANFSIFYFILVLAIVPAAFFSQRPWTLLVINTIIATLHLLPILILKYSRSVRAAAIVFCIATYIATTVHSYLQGGDLSIIVVFWYFLLIIFAHFMLETKCTVGFGALVFIAVSAIAHLRIFAPHLFVISAMPDKILLVTPYILAYGLFILLILLREFSRARKAAEQQVLTALNDKDRILGTVAHDLKNPFGAVRLLLSYIRSAIDVSANRTISKRMDLVEAACDSALGIIDDLVESTNPQQHSAPLMKERVSLNQFVESSIELYQSKAMEKQIVVIADLPDPPVYANVSKIKFSRVLDNLLSNALKFTHPKGQVTLRLIAAGPNAVIEIKDTGIGIPRPLQDQIFDRFSEARRPGTGAERPTGLGLSITKRIIELHGGNITVESEEDRGATFRVVIPISEPSGQIRLSVG